MEERDDVFRISKDKERAKDLLDMAEDRRQLLGIIPKEKHYKLIEEEYEIIKELLTALMYMDGYKTLSHVRLIEYFSQNYTELDEMQVRLIDQLRKLRIGIVYYGKRAGKEFLANNDKEIGKIIDTLMKIAKERLKK